MNFEAIKGAYAIIQYDFIKKMYKNLLKELKGPYHTIPAPSNLFKVNKNALLVSAEYAEIYHENSAKSLWFK